MPSYELFSAFQSMYLLVIPIVISHTLILIFIPSMLGAGSRAFGVGKAAYAYLVQAFGITLMSFGALPALYSVLAQAPLTTSNYIGLLIMFATGGLVFLLHEGTVKTIDDASRAVPAALFFFTFKIIGMISIVLGALTLLLEMLFGLAESTPDWWVAPTVTLIYGLILAWCTRFEEHPFVQRKSPTMTTAPARMPQATVFPPRATSTPPKKVTIISSPTPPSLHAIPKMPLEAEEPSHAHKAKKSKKKE